MVECCVRNRMGVVGGGDGMVLVWSRVWEGSVVGWCLGQR